MLEIFTGAGGVTATTNAGDVFSLTAPSTYDTGTPAMIINPGIPTFYVTGASATEFTSVTFSLTGLDSGPYFFMYDNLTVTAAAIPEPADTAVFAGGAALLLLGWRRRGQRSRIRN